MYLEYWNLKQEPFQNVTDVRFAYLSDQHREGLARLVYLVKGRKLGGVLVGPFGVGKSMVLELLAEYMADQPETRFFRFDALPGGVMVLAKQIVEQFQIAPPPSNVAEALTALQRHCQEGRPAFHHAVLMIDEAQMIRDPEAFDFIHLLTNMRTVEKGASEPKEYPAFTVILSGHNRLAEDIRRHESLQQRLQLLWHLEPLNENQTFQYVQHRVHVAGGDIWIFDEAALSEVYRGSRGLPRLINNICDIALLLGQVARVPRIGRDIVLQAIHDVQASEGAPPPVSSQP
jgi:general secretion pathway protein A